MIKDSWATSRFRFLNGEQTISSAEESFINFSLCESFTSYMMIYVFIRSAWSSDPHFRGSHSFYSTETEKIGVSAAQLAEPVTNKNRKPVST